MTDACICLNMFTLVGDKAISSAHKHSKMLSPLPILQKKCKNEKKVRTGFQ